MAILSDKGTQFRSSYKQGEADYVWYAQELGIKVIYAKKAHPQTKGKIERLFRFIQQDFVREYLHLNSLQENK